MPRRCRERRRSRWATTSASSTTTSRTTARSAVIGPRFGRWGARPQAINTGATLFTLSRLALYRLQEEGFDDARVLRLMRLYDETCLGAL